MKTELAQAILTSHIDKNIVSDPIYRVQLFKNDYKNKFQFSYEINALLKTCHSFCFSVAFINKSGLAALIQSLLDLQERNVKGRIITSNYLQFNEPEIFYDLLALKNIDIRIYPSETAGFHPKGYIFDYEEYSKIIIGSANITQKALLINQEWGICLAALKYSEIVEQVHNEFEVQWQNSIPLTPTWIEEYKTYYVKPKYVPPIYNSKSLIPNKMQVEALNSLQKLRIDKQNKALIISATGTGKTYLSAFDIKDFKPKRMLFVVHRENIATAAKESFKKIIKNKSIGLFCGSKKEIDCDYIFSTIQTIHKKEYRELFLPTDFEYIIIDEVHRAGASTYQQLMDYFKPKFLLGMSATPERQDHFDIFKMFDYNIAYEIRLQQAMEYDLLCPFHYYGITDIIIDGEMIDDKTAFNKLVSKIRVDYIIEKIKQYGFSGNKVHGLIFCSRKQEAKELSKLFNQEGYKTVALTGEDSEYTREKAIERLESDDPENAIDYIFTVDIFNEGIDIPKINQIIMLRPTQSPTIFIQQLGRGLRKDPSKDCVIVIDFIGNYEKNFLIPIALSGNLSYNKDYLRKFMSEASLLLPGESTVNFDLISTKKIYETIDKAKFNNIRLLKESYYQLKNKIGHIPTLHDFEIYESIDALRILENKHIDSYHHFLKKYEPEYKIKFTPLQEKYLSYISKKFANGKRIQELEALKICILKKCNLRKYLQESLNDTYDIQLEQANYETIVNQLTQNFATGSAKNTYKEAIILEKNNSLLVSKQFLKLLSDKNFVNTLLEVIDFGINRYNKYYSERYKNTDLCLYQKYTYEDVCRLLNWDKNIVAQNISGYKYDSKTNTFPVFINYEKEENINETINYEDYFLNENTLIAYSKTSRTLDSDEVKRIYDEKNNNVKIHLFVRKNKDDTTSKEFYYLGLMHAIGTPVLTTIGLSKKNIVQFTYRLEEKVKKDIYDYITN